MAAIVLTKEKGKSNDFFEKKLLEYANRVVTHYVTKGAIAGSDKEDVQMSIVEKFLVKKDRIMSAFQGKSELKTYCIAVLNRMCCEVIRSEVRKDTNYQQYAQDKPFPVYINAANRAVIEDEVKLLEKILVLFDDEKSKVVLFLKFMYDIPINEQDINDYYPDLKPDMKELLMNQAVGLSLSKKNDVLRQLLEQCENKKVSPDAIRMWINKTVSRVIRRLNGTLQRSNYSKESLGILLEYMYCDSKNNNCNYPFISEKLKIMYA